MPMPMLILMNANGFEIRVSISVSKVDNVEADEADDYAADVATSISRASVDYVMVLTFMMLTLTSNVKLVGVDHDDDNANVNADANADADADANADVHYVDDSNKIMLSLMNPMLKLQTFMVPTSISQAKVDYFDIDGTRY